MIEKERGWLSNGLTRQVEREGKVEERRGERVEEEILHPRQTRARVRPCVHPRPRPRIRGTKRGSVNGRAAGHTGSESRKNMSSFHRQSSQRTERTNE